ncbi:toprim domain-containing protein [Echinicola vietnamensis]|uniref:DNA primase n=1 Tax=Echinicola vietnamensis (strain DSM 17526 / LMG 23754 / KMM 6221) TaxID=926556 RepID=L0FUL7_ECHVK|nr:toprim domain-containing protein [Echinicola vietnamensis]AGA76723.1 DNA primase [Echinicola vietnamensis DSM 17526]
MNIKQANELSIIGFLGKLGIKPSKISGDSYFYHSPYRKENTPSFKVSASKNLWVDFGDDNYGGKVLDLVMKLKPGLSVSDAIHYIEDITGNSFSFHPQVSMEKEQEPKITIRSVKAIGSNPALMDYLLHRKVSAETASRFCMEVYYSIGDKKYFGIGNKNENGWAIRNAYWKGSSAQGISYYPGEGEILHMFEGIFDLLSFYDRNKKEVESDDFLVLNSLSNMDAARKIIVDFPRVNLYLDNDIQGKAWTKRLLKDFSQCTDQSGKYLGYKDLNDYHRKSKSIGMRR